MQKCDECGGSIVKGTCHTCGLVHYKEYAVDFNGTTRSPFLPAGGLSIDHKSFTYKYRQRVYKGSNAIKLVKRTLCLPDALCEGAMSHFLKLTKGNNRGTSFRVLAGISLLLESQSWDFPLLEREVIDILDIDERKFFRTRRRLKIIFDDYSPSKLAWKYMMEKKFPQETWREILKWGTRIKSNSKKALAATAVYLATRQLENRDSIDTISWWFETSKASINRAINSVKKRYSI